MRVNYKSDFDFLITPRLASADPEAAPVFPAFDWVATIYTTSSRCAYTASSIGGKLTNCFDDNGRIHIVVDGHSMACGLLQVEFKALIPDVIFPDGTRDTYRIDPVDIELVPGNGDEPADVEISTVLPTIKGDPGKDFTYADFTPEQLADLRRPATEAAALADMATQEAKAAANEAEAAAQSANNAVAMATRVNGLWEANERTRQAHETERQAEEQQRRNAEAERENAATLADGAERLRQQAETARARQETSRQSAEQLRAGAEDLRRSEEEARADAETKRALAEQKRTSGEQQRSEAEALRAGADRERTDNETTRQLMERKRVAAEEQRAAEFAGFRQQIESKPDFDDLSNILGESMQMESEAEFELRTGFTREDLKQDLFDDLWRTAVGPHGTVDHSHVEPDGKRTSYYLNKLWLTYDEAVYVYIRGPISPDNKVAIYRGDHKAKTFLPPLTFNYVISAPLLYAQCRSMEAIFCGDNVIPSEGMFCDCVALTEISGLYSVNSNAASQNTRYLYQNCANLKNIEFGFVHNLSFSLQDSPLLNFATVSRIVAGCRYSESTTTITVHPDVYAKLTGDTSNAAAAALTPEELSQWTALIPQAAEKNIQFATTN